MWFYFIFINLFNLINCYNNIVIKTNDGLVKGEKLTSLFANNNYYAFRGIPYAEPPIGDLRFLAPVPVQPWSNVLDATTFGHKCLEYKQGSEDCLYLNIYLPESNSEELYPVMFFIPGNSYYIHNSGENTLFGPDFFINEDVILVTINYRIGIFGFLKIHGNPLYSGNMGLKDQCLALKWIYENIEHFGGDKSRITVFGFGDGASSAHLQTLSVCNSFIQRIILQSGSALNSWSYAQTSYHEESLINRANYYGVDHVNDSDSLVEFLKNVEPAYILSQTPFPFKPYSIDDRRVFTAEFIPVIEEDDVEDPFMVDRPEVLFESIEDTSIDLMIGHSSHEFAYFMISGEASNPNVLKAFNEHFKIQMPRPGNLEDDFDNPTYRRITNYVREYYFGQQEINNETIYNYIDLLSDIFYAYGIQKTVQKYSTFKSAKTYYYNLSFDSELNLNREIFDKPLGQTIHSDEICYIFRCDLIDSKYQEIAKYSLDFYLMKYLIQFWTNFAKYGDPTPYEKPIYWKPVTPSRMEYLDISNDLFIMSTSNIDRMHLWDDVLRNI